MFVFLKCNLTFALLPSRHISAQFARFSNESMDATLHEKRLFGIGMFLMSLSSLILH